MHVEQRSAPVRSPCQERHADLAISTFSLLILKGGLDHLPEESHLATHPTSEDWQVDQKDHKVGSLKHSLAKAGNHGVELPTPSLGCVCPQS